MDDIFPDLNNLAPAEAPADPAAPPAADPAAAADPANPADPADPAVGADPADPSTADPSKGPPSAAADPADPANPAEPADPNAEADPKPDEAEPAFDVVAKIHELVPGAGVGAPEDIPEAFQQIYQDTEQYAQALAVVEAAEERAPGTAALLRMLGEGKHVVAALAEAFPELAEALDVEQGTEAWQQLEIARRERAVHDQYRQKETTQTTDQQQRWQQAAERTFEGFQQRHKDGFGHPADSGLTLDGFRSFYASLFLPEVAKTFRGDHFDVVRKAYTYDHDVQAAEVKGYEKALGELKAKGLLPDPAKKTEPGAGAERSSAGDRVPMPRGQGGQPPGGDRQADPGYLRTTPTLDDIYGPEPAKQPAR